MGQEYSTREHAAQDGEGRIGIGREGRHKTGLHQGADPGKEELVSRLIASDRAGW